MDKNRSHILILPKWYPTERHPSAGIFIKKHAECVADKMSISVLYVESDESIHDWRIHWRFAQVNGVDTWRASYAKNFFGFSFIDKILKLAFYFIASFRGVIKIEKEKGRIDLLNPTVMLRTGLVALLFKKIRGKPFLVTEHWTGYLPEDGAYRGAFRKWLCGVVLTHSECVLTASRHLESAMKAHGLAAPSWDWLPNVVDTDVFVPLDRAQRRGSLLVVANLDDRQKNISGILHVIAEVKAIRSDFELKIVGAGIDKVKLEEMSGRLLLNYIVKFLGPKNTQEVAAVMAQSGVLLSFSHFENLPCVMVEAQSCGIPTFATNVGGVSETIQSQALGVLLMPGDKIGLRDAILDFLGGKLSFDEAEIRGNALSKFSKKAVAEILTKKYSKFSLK